MILHDTYPFHLPPLPYPYDALEPYIDTETMYFHHDKHFKTYVDNLNAALKNYPKYHSFTLEELLTHLSELPDSIRTFVQNNGGGVYNHDLYFDLMAPGNQEIPSFISKIFGGSDLFKAQMKEAALHQFGSGFAWLVADSSGALKIISLPNQDTPLAHGYSPILPLDVWEHAYYLKYQNLRGTYIDSWFHVINWEEILLRMKSNVPSALQ